jgi:hypothetical protein
MIHNEIFIFSKLIVMLKNKFYIEITFPFSESAMKVPGF